MFGVFECFSCFLNCCFCLVFMSDEPSQNWLHPPRNFIAGRPKAALLFWFFGNFRYGVLLFMVIFIIFKYKGVAGIA